MNTKWPWLRITTKLYGNCLTGHKRRLPRHLVLLRVHSKDGEVSWWSSCFYSPLSAQHVSCVNTHVTVASALIHTSGKPMVSFPPSILAVGRLQPFDQADFVRYMTELSCAKHPWGSWHLCSLKEKKEKSESQLLPPALLIKRMVSQQERWCFSQAGVCSNWLVSFFEKSGEDWC